MLFDFGKLVLLKKHLWMLIAIAVLPLISFAALYDHYFSNFSKRLLIEHLENDLATSLLKTTTYLNEQRVRLEHIADLPEVDLVFSDTRDQELPSSLLDLIYYEMEDADIYSLLFYDLDGVFIRSFPYWSNQSHKNLNLEKRVDAETTEAVQWTLPTAGHPGVLLLKKAVLKDRKLIGIIGIEIRLASMTEQATSVYLKGDYEPLFITPHNVALSVIGHVKQLTVLLAESEDFLPGWSIALQAHAHAKGKKASRISIRLWILLAVTVSALGAILLFFSMTVRLARMITPLKDGAQAIANGCLGVIVPEDGLGEIGSLGRSFNEMSRQLDNIISSRVVSERQASLGILAAGIAHEVRNPLSTILATVHGLFRLENDYNKKEMLRVINSEVVRTDLIVEEFMNYARPRDPHKEIILIEKALKKVSILISGSALDQGIKISKLGDMSLKMFVDSGQLSQILMNIVLNGMQAMPGGGHLILKVQNVQNEVHLSVTDTGSGIPQDQIEKISVPFFTTKKQGTGLGLSICMRLVKANDGRLEIESVEGRGTMVTLIFEAVK